MRMASVKEFRTELANMMTSEEPVMVTRHGKVAGFYLPWKGEDLPLSIKREALKKYTQELDKVFEGVDINEEELEKDFAEFRKARHSRR